MTAPQLLAWISAALLLQLAAGVAWTLWRRSIGPAGGEIVPAPPARADAAWSGWRTFRVVRREYEDPAQTQCSFYLQPADGQPLPPYKPGQFLTFALDLPAGVGDAAADARTITRCYSLSDRPDPACYRVTIKRVPPPPDHPEYEPGLSSSHFHDRVQAGDELRVKAPSGHFFIDADAAVPAVLVAGGIGVTPMMSMLRWCLAHQPERTLHFYYGLRNSREHAFKAQLEALAAAHPNLRLHVAYSRPEATDAIGGDYQHRGHVDVELLQRTLPHGRHRFYVCGPPAMMQTLVPALAAWGVPIADLRYEAFGPATVKLPGAAPAEATAVGRSRGAVLALRPHPDLGRAGRFVAGFRRAPWRRRRRRVPLGRLRHLRDPPRRGFRALRACTRPRSRRGPLPALRRPTRLVLGARRLMPLKARLLRREVLPFVASFALLALLALALDGVLHLLDMLWIGRWLGIPGTLLIIGSTAYSLRKRKLIKSGHPAKLLRWHEGLAWLGSLLVLVHAGVHFNAILGWLAVGAMLINVGSGLTGKFLLDRARRRLEEARQRSRARGLAEADIVDQLYWDSMTFDAVKQWRVVHFPITLAFAVLAIAHIVAIFLFWGWH